MESRPDESKISHENSAHRIFNQYHLPPSLLFCSSCKPQWLPVAIIANSSHQISTIPNCWFACINFSAGVSGSRRSLHLSSRLWIVSNSPPRVSLFCARLDFPPPFSFFSPSLRAPLISGSIPLEINISGKRALASRRSRRRRFVNHTPKATNLQESTKDTELFKARRNYIFSTIHE